MLFLDDVMLISVLNSMLKYLKIRLQERFNSTIMSINLFKFFSLYFINGNDQESSPLKIGERNARSHSCCNSPPLTDFCYWKDVMKQLRNGLRFVDKRDLIAKVFILALFPRDHGH